MQAFETGMNGLGLIAMITIAYSIVQRFNWPRWLRHVCLGIVFGAGACNSMLLPVELGPGMIADSRNLFIAFSGGFLGPLGAVISFAIAAAMRVHLGGAGMFIGLTSMFLAMCIGISWSLLQDRNRGRSLEQLALMGLSLSLTFVVGLVALDGDARKNFLTIMPYLTIFNLVGTLIFGGLVERERRNARRVRSLLTASHHDPLTNALNRRGLEDLYSQTMHRTPTNGRGILLIDLDHFKKINDTHGHAAGDETLKMTTQAIRETMRSTDLLARVGGEEFVVLFSDISELDFARMSERIRMSVKQARNIDHRQVTVSIGGTFWQDSDRTLDEALKKADALMYRAKTEGRDRIVSDLPLACAA